MCQTVTVHDHSADQNSITYVRSCTAVITRLFFVYKWVHTYVRSYSHFLFIPSEQTRYIRTYVYTKADEKGATEERSNSTKVEHHVNVGLVIGHVCTARTAAHSPFVCTACTAAHSPFVCTAHTAAHTPLCAQHAPWSTDRLVPFSSSPACVEVPRAQPGWL